MSKHLCDTCALDKEEPPQECISANKLPNEAGSAIVECEGHRFPTNFERITRSPEMLLRYKTQLDCYFCANSEEGCTCLHASGCIAGMLAWLNQEAVIGDE